MATVLALTTEPSYETFLKNHTLGQIFEQVKHNQSQALVTIPSHKTVEDTLHLLKQHNILAVPVVDEKIPASDNAHFVGIVNLMDIVSVAVFQPIFSSFNTDSKLAEIKEETLVKIQNLAVLKQPISEVLGVSKESKRLWIFNVTDSAESLCDAFTLGVHRVLVRIDANRVGILSQSDVVRFLYMNAKDKALQACLHKSIRELGMHVGDRTKSLIQLQYNSTALTGFRRMSARDELQALPVVFENGVVLGALSASDLRGMTQDKFSSVLLPVTEFLKAVNTSTQAMRPPLCVLPGTPLINVIELMLKSHVHRAWVVTHYGIPTDVVSMTDIVRVFSTYGKWV